MFRIGIGIYDDDYADDENKVLYSGHLELTARSVFIFLLYFFAFAFLAFFIDASDVPFFIMTFRPL